MMNLVVLTGAGVSAESGIPTFRGKEGLWKNFKPEELATPEAFRKTPSWFGNGMIGEDSL
jgi:NAD-dependent deacetylase